MDVLEEIEYKLKNIPPELSGYAREDYKNRLYAKRSRHKRKIARQHPLILKALEAEIHLAVCINEAMGSPYTKITQCQAKIIIARHGSEEAKRLSKLVSQL